MKRIKNYVVEIAICVFELLIGILLLVDPVGLTTVVFVAGGVLMVLMGAWETVKYFRMDPESAARSQLLVKGMVLLLCGGFCVLKYEWFLVTFPLLTVIYGIVILLTGLRKAQRTVDGIRLKWGKWYLSAISAVVSILCAIIIIRNPFASTAALWMFTGISMIVEAVFDAVALIFGTRKPKAAAEAPEETVIVEETEGAE